MVLVQNLGRGLTGLDMPVLVGYLAGITTLGIWMSRKVRNTAGFFLGATPRCWLPGSS